MPTPRSRYTTKELDAAVLTVLAGECGKIVSLKTRIPYSTLMRKMRESRAGTRKDPQRRGPKTSIPQPCEADLVAWIGAMQQNGYPPSRQAVLVKATQMLRRIDPLQTALTSGWYKKFRARHKDLTNRVAQVISRARNSVDEAGVDRMFNSVHKTVIENKLTADRIFNMDETAFASRRKSSTVIALKGSQNVWAKTVSPSFHLSIVACVSASGNIMPPLFLFPGETVAKNLSFESSVVNATVTTSPKESLTVLRPVLLIFDGLAAHFSSDIVDLCKSLEIILLCLPANATHLFQPLDVAVFGPYKTAIRKAMFEELVSNDTGDVYTIAKPAALRIASTAWTKSMIPANAISGFKATGLWPLSKPQMMKRFGLFKHGGVPKSYLQAYWIERRDVLRREMLTLPADEKKRASGRSTIDVGGRILTLELLHEVDKTKEQRQAATKRKNALKATRGKRGKPIVLSKKAFMWARIAGSLGLAPLPNGRANAVRVDAVEYVL
ncbi:hypothetical protein AaE_009356 [Aphanomyces astaci]|uniref:HTH CENPB-type domain-containing protein n=1 Tax=Aphanomyces astaci TaxID=112090 RepID=A0A6A5A812_APHAT|nr:hypothetical protein AaE_009356 [Aphanomyces astaci]